jgi:hypothetical protein
LSWPTLPFSGSGKVQQLHGHLTQGHGFASGAELARAVARSRIRHPELKDLITKERSDETANDQWSQGDSGG